MISSLITVDNIIVYRNRFDYKIVNKFFATNIVLSFLYFGYIAITLHNILSKMSGCHFAIILLK